MGHISGLGRSFMELGSSANSGGIDFRSTEWLRRHDAYETDTSDHFAAEREVNASLRERPLTNDPMDESDARRRPSDNDRIIVDALGPAAVRRGRLAVPQNITSDYAAARLDSVAGSKHTLDTLGQIERILEDAGLPDLADRLSVWASSVSAKLVKKLFTLFHINFNERGAPRRDRPDAISRFAKRATLFLDGLIPCPKLRITLFSEKQR